MYKYVYDENKQTIKLSLSPKGLAFSLGIAVFLMGGMGLALLFVATGFYFLVGIFAVIFAVCFSVYAIAEYKNSYTILTREGICVYWGAKEKRYLRWDECRFIGIYGYPSRYSHAGLFFSRHPVPRDPDGKVSKAFILPKDETIDLSDLWETFSEEQQNQILDFCGGMRG